MLLHLEILQVWGWTTDSRKLQIGNLFLGETLQNNVIQLPFFALPIFCISQSWFQMWKIPVLQTALFPLIHVTVATPKLGRPLFESK